MVSGQKGPLKQIETLLVHADQKIQFLAAYDDTRQNCPTAASNQSASHDLTKGG
jgi:hypothetical protein